MTLTEFLLARIAEEETAARAGLGEPTYPHYGDTAAEEYLSMADREGCSAGGFEHFERWMPARVLAECEAKRRIVDRCVDRDDEQTLRFMGLPFVDRPDYRDEWRP